MVCSDLVFALVNISVNAGMWIGIICWSNNPDQRWWGEGLGRDQRWLPQHEKQRSLMVQRAGLGSHMDQPVSQEPSSISQAWAYLVTRSGAIHNSCVASGTREARAPGYAEPVMALSCMAQDLVLDSTHEILNASALVPVQRRTEMGEASTYCHRGASEETNGRGDVWKT